MRTQRLRLTAALILAVLTLLPAVAWLANPTAANAQSQQYHMDNYDSRITVNPDGSLDIVETLAYSFDSGTFRRGLRVWDLEKLDSITEVKVTETTDGQEAPYTFGSFDPDETRNPPARTYGLENTGGQLRLRWIYGQTSNAKRSFQVSYHVNGAIRVYDDRDELQWYAVPPDWGSDIDKSEVIVTFPAGADTSGWTTEAVPSFANIGKQGNVITYSTVSGLGGGFEVGAKVPKGVLAATKPSWQESVDNRERLRPLLDVGLLLLSALVLVGGIMWGISRWYRRGRDLPVKLPIDYMAEPPSDLPPGLVGTLLDESADVRDVISTVVDQGQKGNLTITETQRGGLLSSPDFEYTMTGGAVDYRYEQMVLNALFRGGQQSVQLSDLKNSFYTSLPAIYTEMYQTLVALKYFPENPQAVRARNIGLGVSVIGLGALVFFGGFVFGDMFSWMILALGAALAIVGIVWAILGAAMPRKTDKGAEETAKWRAFQRYLEQIQTYTNVQEAADRFQKYLPYAVALGVDQQFVRQFNSVPQAMPTWYHPYGWYPYPYVTTGSGQSTSTSTGTGGGGGMVGGPIAGQGFDPGGAMQSMSDSLGGAMQGLSDSFTSMVNSASNVLTSSPSSSGSGGGGGWGGGGGGFGGGGGGGGGGGAD
jgi:type II secretory pathway pseudopilin PulG